MSKHVSINFDGNLICKHCGISTAVAWENFREQTDKFMSEHKDCRYGDDFITMEQIAKMAGVSKKSIQPFSKKLGLPEPVKKGKAGIKLFSKVDVVRYLETNNLAAVLAKVRNERYLASKPNAPVTKGLAIGQNGLPMMNLFIRGAFDTKEKKDERLRKFSASAKANRKRKVLKCFEDEEGNLIRKFV